LLIISDYALIAFSASPHFHTAAVLIDPPPHAPIHGHSEELAGHGVRDLQGRLSLSRERIFPVMREYLLESKRVCGITIEIDLAPGVAASASMTATWTCITPGPGSSTIWYLFARSSVSVLWKRAVSSWSSRQGCVSKEVQVLPPSIARSDG
jgi:hypothetical protein